MFLNPLYGQAADDIEIRLDRLRENEWVTIARTRTNKAGRVDGWNGLTFEPGLYRIGFDVGRYFGGVGLKTVYPEIEVTFRINDVNDNYHIQVVLATYSYSTHFSAVESCCS